MLTERQLQERARDMRRNPTEWEKRLWRALSNRQLGYKLRRQAVLFPYICDFFCPAKGVAIEVDGDTHDAVYDERRDERLLARGVATLRFTNLDVRDNIEGVLLTIEEALASRLNRWSVPHPNPSPEGEGLVEGVSPSPSGEKLAPYSSPSPPGEGLGVGEVSPRPNP